jgi:hypothetical protein
MSRVYICYTPPYRGSTRDALRETAGGVVSVFFGTCNVRNEDNARQLRDVPCSRASFSRVIGRGVVFFWG